MTVKKRTKTRATQTERIAKMIEEFRAALIIDKYALDDELMAQPEIFFNVSEAAVNAGAHRDFLKEEIGRIDADRAAYHRRKLEKSGARATDAAVKLAVDGDPKHQKAVDAYIEARKNADLLQALKDAFHQRSYAVRDLGGLFIANYFERNAIQGGERGKDLRGQKAIDKMNEVRKGTNSRNSRRSRKKE